jgi:hypothetical protein
MSDSDLSVTAVYVNFHAGDVRGILRSQERHRACHFLGRPNRFIGTLETTSFANSSKASFDSPVLPKIGVTIGPGATAFTRMPRPASSAAAVLARERSAAFVAE